MARFKRANVARKRRIKVLRTGPAAFRASGSKLFRTANQRVMKATCAIALQGSAAAASVTFRRLWIARINRGNA